MSGGITGHKPNHYIGGQYDSPWGIREGIFALPKEVTTKIFKELDPASQTAASFASRAFKEIHPPVGQLHPTFCTDALQAGHMELVRWGIDNKYRPCLIIQQAIKDGNLDLLKLIEQFGGTISSNLPYWAIDYTQLTILQWLYERLGPEMLRYELDERAFFKGAQNIRDWLKEKGCPPYPPTV